MTLTRRRRDTGPDRHTRFLLEVRAASCCEVCGLSVAQRFFSVHHRVARGMGGTRAGWANALSNLLLLCGSGTTGCHGEIESNRDRAYANGWLVRSGVVLPAEVPVLTWHGGRVLLDDAGNYISFPEAV